jgi:TPP-dependent pyruvate/acetoin dehydrogenase alpha subunit
MRSNWTVDKLKDFENFVADIFNKGEIKAPVHLSDGNEKELIEIFQAVGTNDWVFSSWRSHYHCLLKGVPPSELLEEIKIGRSISLGFPKYKVFSSAIVGGILPIATGVAKYIKIMGLSDQVWCFIGDMTSETGIAQTSIRYAETHDLPINFIIEDNGISVLTDTRTVWESHSLRFEERPSRKVKSYKYKSKFPHAGAGVRVQF